MIRPIASYMLRIFSRGNGATPLPPAEQPVFFARPVSALEGTQQELLGPAGHPSHPGAPTLAVIADQKTPGGEGGVYWSADESGPAIILGIDIPLPDTPEHGFRAVWERR